MRQRLLWVKAGRILPVDTGGKIRSFHLARQLAKRHELTFLSYYDGSQDAAYDAALAEAFPGSVALATGLPTDGGLRRSLHYLTQVLNPAPYAVAKFANRGVRERVAAWDRERRFDVLICDFLSATLNFPAKLHTPAVLFQHNVEAALWARQAMHEGHLLKRAAFQIEARKMAAYEPKALRRFAHIVAVSEHDRSLMRGAIDPTRITVVPTGVDLTQYSAARGRVGNAPLVLFLGSMDWEANIDGVQWFCRDVWPAVVSRVPGAVFRVVGRNPSAAIRALAGPGIEITGTVPSVVEHLQQSAVFVVPLRVGGGTRLKIYEAMATGRAVVSTSVGAEGLDVTDGVDVILADEAAPFADAVVNLLEDRGRRERFEARAFETATRYDWSQVVAHFEDALLRARAG